MRASRPRTAFDTRWYLPAYIRCITPAANRARVSTKVALRPPTLIMRPLALVLLSIACSRSLAVQPRLAHLALRTSSSRSAAPRKDLVASVAASPPSDSMIKAPPHAPQLGARAAWDTWLRGLSAPRMLKARLNRCDTSGIS